MLDPVGASEVEMANSSAVEVQPGHDMLIHITPRFYIPRYIPMPISECRLLSLRIEQLGIELKGADLVSRRPYPNKRYWVASRHIGRKSLIGILLQTPGHVPSFTVIARWAVNEEHIVAHEVEYRIADADFNAASDNMILWNELQLVEGSFASRTTTMQSPLLAQPRMEIFADLPEGETRRTSVEDTVSADRFIVLRREVFTMPTIEPERLFCTEINKRMPSIESAILCNA